MQSNLNRESIKRCAGRFTEADAFRVVRKETSKARKLALKARRALKGAALAIMFATGANAADLGDAKCDTDTACAALSYFAKRMPGLIGMHATYGKGESDITYSPDGYLFCSFSTGQRLRLCPDAPAASDLPLPPIPAAMFDSAGLSKAKFCGNMWKQERATLAESGHTWQTYRAACFAALTGKKAPARASVASK